MPGKERLAEDLKHLEELAFRRREKCGPLVERFHRVAKGIEAWDGAGLVWRVYEWLLAPLSLWPIDFEGLSEHLLQLAEADRELDADLVLLLRMLDGPPARETQAAVAEFEHYVQSGGYERFLRQREKFDEQEQALMADEELAGAWEQIKRRFAVKEFANSRGVIRRRMSQERNFREGWEFDWADGRRRFHLFFDALCHRWKLYGMEGDRPLLLKMSVNPTPHGTMIVIPRHWSLDPRRDLDWKMFGRMHRARVSRKQGPKLSAGRLARMEEARAARALWAEAERNGLRGRKRYEYVRERMGRDVRMDPGWLRRLLKAGEARGRNSSSKFEV